MTVAPASKEKRTFESCSDQISERSFDADGAAGTAAAAAGALACETVAAWNP